MGIAGGGVNALRGESNVQGSTDQGLLFHVVPGYLPAPRAQWARLEDYNKATPSTKDPRSVNWWKNRPKYVASLLKSFYGDKATKDNDLCYAWLPKLDPAQDASWLNLFDEMYKGTFTVAYLFYQMGRRAASGHPASIPESKPLPGRKVAGR